MWLSLIAAIVCEAAALASAQTPSLVEQALAEPARIHLTDVKLADVVALIAERTGVSLSIGPEIIALIPGGSEAVLEKVNISDIPLREGLTKLLSPLGLTLVVEQDTVRIVPREVLRRLGRAATWEELDLLAELTSTPLGSDVAALSAFRSKFQFQGIAGQPWDVLSAALVNVGAGPGDEVLTLACENLGWAWSLSNDYLVVTSAANQISRRLRQPVSLRMNDRPLFDVMAALGDRVGVPIRTEAGTFSMVPHHIQTNFSLVVQNQPAELALEKIAAYAGLGYLVGADGVTFYQPKSAAVATESAAAAGPDPYVGKVTIELSEGRSMEWLIRASELPEDLKARRESDLGEAFEKIRSRPASR